MREFDDKILKPPFSLSEAVTKMYEQTWFDSESIRYEWNDVEIIIRKLS